MERFFDSTPRPFSFRPGLPKRRLMAPRLALLYLATLLLAGSTAYGSTIIGAHSGNGVSSSATTTAGFVSLGGGDLVTSPLTSAISDIGASPGTSITASATNAPMGGTGTAEGDATLNFTYGTAITDDIFEFIFDATASALTAQNLPPLVAGAEDADALVFMTLRAEFMLDSGIGGAVTDDFLGFLNLGPLRPTHLYETFSAIVLDDSSSVASLSPGSAPAAVPLFADHFYEIEISYEYLVPHGIDPSQTLTVAGSIGHTAIPEPSTALMLALGLAGLAAGSHSKPFGRAKR